MGHPVGRNWVPEIIFISNVLYLCGGGDGAGVNDRKYLSY